MLNITSIYLKYYSIQKYWNFQDTAFIKTQIIPFNNHVIAENGKGKQGFQEGWRKLYVPFWTQITRFNKTHFHSPSGVKMYAKNVSTWFQSFYDDIDLNRLEFDEKVISNPQGKLRNRERHGLQ